MTIKECYEIFGGDYGGILGRFRKEERIEKYILKFSNDHSFELLKDSLENGSIEEAFRGAHTLKGLSQNLGFSKLEESASLLTEALRKGDIENACLLFEEVNKDYSLTLSSIREYMKEMEIN